VNTRAPSGRTPLRFTVVTAAATALALAASSGNAADHNAGAHSAAPAPRSSAPAARPAETPSPFGSLTAAAGSAGLGDEYFPEAGNGGYDALHYDVTLTYREDRSITATSVMTARATQDLGSFSLDYRGPKVVGVRVNERPAAFSRKGQELVITPDRPLTDGRTFTVEVRYTGRPHPRTSSELGSYGWIPTKDGAVTLSQPDGTPTWLPVNDHPLDKATYTFRITVPEGLQALANGTPVEPPAQRGKTVTRVWQVTSPMASYLAMIAIGKFEVRRSQAGGIPVITAVDPAYAKHAAKLERDTVTATTWLTELLGHYPFPTAGGIIDDPQLHYALEAQERPVYAGFAPAMNFVVHEMAHQWFGNSVSLTRWPDIWLNEGFATYTEWLWREHRSKGKNTAQKIFNRYYRQPGTSVIFRPPPGKPGAREMFGYSVYIRGAMTVHALRQRIGDEAFFRVMRTWAELHRHGNARTEDLIALAERESGKQLDRLFKVWLYQKGKPKSW